MVKKSKRRPTATKFVSLLALMLIIVNLYVCWRISEINGSIALQIFGTVINGLSQLIAVIMINTLALAVLIITRD